MKAVVVQVQVSYVLWSHPAATKGTTVVVFVSILDVFCQTYQVLALWQIVKDHRIDNPGVPFQLRWLSNQHYCRLQSQGKRQDVAQ
jgi:hypothetical protein